MNGRARAFEQRFNLRFNNITLLTEALTAPGVHSPEGNKGHGLFGDTALQLALQREGREREQRVGQISTVVSGIADNRNLAQRGFALSVDQYIRNNPSQGTYVAPGLMATTMEAIVGAYFLDQEYDFAALPRVLAILGLSWPELIPYHALTPIPPCTYQVRPVHACVSGSRGACSVDTGCLSSVLYEDITGPVSRWIHPRELLTPASADGYKGGICVDFGWALRSAAVPCGRTAGAVSR